MEARNLMQSFAKRCHHLIFYMPWEIELRDVSAHEVPSWVLPPDTAIDSFYNLCRASTRFRSRFGN